MEEIKRLNEIIKKSKRIVIFSGAGVSTESGIPDYRSADGLYETNGDGIPPETILSHSFFMERTEDFYNFYKSNMVHPSAKPNPCHTKAAEMEKCGKLKAVVTQNIDGLYTAAGCVNVYELHGSAHRNTCMKCGRKFGLDHIIGEEGVPKCSCSGTVKPDVVLYEEALPENTVRSAVREIAKADCLLIMGTSLTVYPASGFINYFGGENLVLINKSKILADFGANLVIRRNAGEVMSQILL